MDESLKKSIIRRQRHDFKTVKDGEAILNDVSDVIKGGDDVFGYTMGKLSLIDLVEQVASDAGGACNFYTCIWSANHVDVYRLWEMQRDGLLAGMKFVIDPSVYSRKREAVKALYEYFGSSAIRTVNTHAKFVVLQGKTKTLSIISSMNFTRNPRIELYQILHCPKIAGHTIGLVDDIFEKYEPGENFSTQGKEVFDKIRGRIEKESVMDRVFKP